MHALSAPCNFTMRPSTSLLCSANSHPILGSRRFSLPLRSLYTISKASSSPIQVRVNFLQTRSTIRVSPPHSTAIEEIVEESTTDSEFIEIGYIYDVHGLQGEICVKHSTDFPELRFSKPGKRWLRQQFSGRREIQEVELVSGRDHPARKCWIVKFGGIDSIDQAKQLVGSTLLVREDDRPQLEEGEFYSRELVGMRVILKETGESIGTVLNVYNSGASDLLHVMLDSYTKLPVQRSEKVKSGPLVWIPFVEAIVPDVDMIKREMQITPPKGLLQLNLPNGERSKKERRLLEWKERKKMQRLLIAAKKKLCAMGQQHVFHGFRFGEKSQRNLLADQIISVNSKLLQQALQNREMPLERSNLVEYISGASTLQTSNLRISQECLTNAWKQKLDKYSKFQCTGLDLISKGKLATVLVLSSGKLDAWSEPCLGDCKNSPLSLVEKFLSDNQRFMEVEQRASVSIISISSNPDIQPLEKLFSSHDHFGFNPKKVWFLEEEKLPVVSSSVDEQNRHKILMKSPWEILQSPIGSGGILFSISSNNIIEDLIEMGVEYVELCSIDQLSLCGNPIFLGFIDSWYADIGIHVLKNPVSHEDNFHMIFSMKLMKKMIQQIGKLHFEAILKPNPHVEKVDKEWVDVTPPSANSYEFRSSIYRLPASCSLDKVCLIEVTE
ncbi:hypothetical protein Ancab_005572 [Ancistrocladus abbreviatus]